MNNVDKIIVSKRESLLSQLSNLSVKIATLELEKAQKRKELNDLICLTNKAHRKRMEERRNSYPNIL